MKDRLKYAKEMGRDSVLNGANTTNCNFRLFESELTKKAWEEGRAEAQAEITQKTGRKE